MTSSTGKTRFIFLFIFLLPSFIFSQIYERDYNRPQNDIMPYPASITIYRGFPFVFNPSVSVSVDRGASEKLTRAVKEFTDRINAKTGFKITPEFLNQERAEEKGIIIKFGKEETVKTVNDEAYGIEVSQDRIILKSNTDIGAMRGLETILQLIKFSNDRYYIPALKISDYPRFPWRGLMIDACRHFMPVDVVKRNIDGMTAVKLNVLHWHLSENQGFRVECRTFPKLHELGSDGDYYTQEQIKEIIQYANERGIRVVPEFDIPGHSTAWFVGYPEFASAPGPYEIERHFGVFDPCFDPTKESTYEFFDKFFEEMSQLFNDEYIHIGGDENEGKHWDANPQIQEFKKQKGFATNHELQAYFNSRIQKILEKHGKKMIGWDEILSEDLPKDIVIHSWRGKDAMVKAAKLGFASILSSGYYIDLCQSVFDHYYNDPLPKGLPLTTFEEKMILGGEATMWAELVNAETVDSRIWPRAAAISEVLWSGIKSFSEDSLDNRFILFKRLDNISNVLGETGLRHKSNRKQMLERISVMPDAVEKILSVWEPLKYYNRHKYTKYNRSTPLNRAVDIAVPDAPLSFEFAYLVGRIITGKADKEEIESGIKTIKELEKTCGGYLGEKQNGNIEETEILAEKTKGLCSVISGLLYCLQNKTRYGEESVKFDYYRQPTAELELTLVNPAEELYKFIERRGHIK
ncbi:MAG TPA: family 20 glycosylhydrolase [Ignavibacteria bacterium]|nr:family 20 glycosylhydrolase [Ignavibacteria bacterium]